MHTEERATMGKRLHLVRIHEAPAGLVADKGIVCPAVPERLDDARELICTRVAFGMVRHGIQTEVACRGQIRRRDHVPARTPATHVIECGEAPGDVVGLVVAGGGRADQADVRGRRRNAGQHHSRLQRGDGPEMDLIDDGRVVGQEHGVELGRFRNPRHVHIVLHVDKRSRVTLGKPPGRRHKTGVQDVDVQMQLADVRVAHGVLRSWTSSHLTGPAAQR